MITAADLILVFQQALDEEWGYIYGKTHEMWSAEKQKEYVKDYRDDPDRTASVLYGGKWAKHWVTDCSGLFRHAFSRYGLYIAHGSNTIWDKYCTNQGNLRKGKRIDGKELLPGTAVFTTASDGRHNHIGLYVGNGTVIEAQGCKAGVTTSRITDPRWSVWGELRGVSYKQKEGTGMTAKVVLPTGATGNTVNMRERPSRDSGIILRVPVGATVEVLIDQGQWIQIEYGGKAGYMMADYLEYGQGGESGTEMISVPRGELEKIYDKLGDWLGLRG